MEGMIYRTEIPQMFDLELTLDCGQAFRWKKDEHGNMCAAVGNKYFSLCQKDGMLYCNCTKEEFDSVLRRYLDFDRDYKKITDGFSQDENLRLACEEFSGIRILRQEPWETLCSFIISQNNNIPRIKGIVSRFCENFGEEIQQGVFAFPGVEKTASLSVEDLSVLRAGFRAKYIIDAARKVSCGEVDFEKIEHGDIEFGREELVKIKGVGKKVAECTLLYGFGKLEAFPIDVWVKRIIQEMYPEGLPECIKNYEGIAQQYLFHWRRNSKRFETQ